MSYPHARPPIGGDKRVCCPGPTVGGAQNWGPRTGPSLNYGIIEKHFFRPICGKKYVIFELHKSFLFVFFLIVLEIVVKNPPTQKWFGHLSKVDVVFSRFEVQYAQNVRSAQVRCSEKEGKEKKKIEALEIF